jgi:hypothetical protein
MPQNPTVDEAAQLAERMLQVLDAQRSFGGDAYPPTLRHLGELCDGAPPHDLIVKAATKKAFTARAVVTEKADKTPSLDSPVYFKEDLPKREEVLARRMLRVLESQRRLGGADYPPTLRRLAELCQVDGSDARIPKAVAHATLADRTTLVAKAGTRPNLDAPVVFREDLEGSLSPVLPALLRFALSPVTTSTQGKTVETAAFNPAELSKRVIPDLRERVAEAVERGIAGQDLPPGIAWVTVKGVPLLFLMENLRPMTADDRQTASAAPAQGAISATATTAAAPPAPARDFEAAFREAFERLDRRTGSTNFVKLADLRSELSDFSREEFDAGLRSLRSDGLFALERDEGPHGSLTDEERESGVREAGSLLVYASRS